MKDLTDFVTIGEKVGLTGDELLNFAKDELAKYEDKCEKYKAECKKRRRA